MASLILFALGDMHDFAVFGDNTPLPWTVVTAPIGAALALRWRSAPLAHVAALGLIFAFAWVADRIDPTGGPWLFLSVWLALLAAVARHLRAQGREFASAFYGWFAWAALLFFAISVPDHEPLAHRATWITASAGAIALGRFDRHALVTAAGVVSLIAAIAALLMDLGLDLLSAAAVFFACALVASIVGLLLRRKAKA
jgi:hypothetical protein